MKIKLFEEFFAGSISEESVESVKKKHWEKFLAETSKENRKQLERRLSKLKETEKAAKTNSDISLTPEFFDRIKHIETLLKTVMESELTESEEKELGEWENEDQMDEAAKNSQEVTPKDEMRIRDILRKAAGNTSKAIQLAQTMAKLITEPNKAARRANAALEAGQRELAAIFNKRAEELGAFSG